MKALFVMVATVLAVGCGKDNCSPSDVNGVYRVSTTWLSGTCGNLGTIVIHVNKGETVADSGCVMSYDRWDDSGCSGESDMTCIDSINGTHTRMITISTLEPGGYNLKATVTMTLTSSTGASICSGTYDFDYSHS